MRAVIQLNDETYKKAANLSGIKEKSKLVNAALELMINREVVKQLVKFAGSYKKASVAPRHRMA